MSSGLGLALTSNHQPLYFVEIAVIFSHFDTKGAVLDFFFYVLLAGCLLLLVLPISLVLRVNRPEIGAPINAEISLGLYRACMGIALQIRDSQPSVHVVLFSRAIHRPALRLAKEKKTSPSAPSEVEVPPQDQPVPLSHSPPPSEPLKPKNELKAMDWIRISLPPALRLLKRFPRVISLYSFLVKGHFGLEDPMQTGALYGYQRALLALPFKKLRLELIPNFCDQGFIGQARIAIGIHVGTLLLIALRFALHAGLRYVQARYTSRPLRFF